MLRAQTAKVAGRVAETEEEVAQTLAHLASQNPDHGSRLRDKSEAAAEYAAYERQEASRHAQPRRPAADEDSEG